MYDKIYIVMKNNLIIDEYRWRSNYAVLSKNESGEYFLESNNLRCALTLIRTNEFEGVLYTEPEIFAVYAEMFRLPGNDVRAAAQRGVIDSKKHAAVLEYKELEKTRTVFIIEGERLIKRAVDGGLMLQSIIYSGKSTLESDGCIEKAACPCFVSNEGIMSALSSTKPVPFEIAACIMPQYGLDALLYGEYTSLLITDCINNPDNLGLVIRTADACGADAVIVTGQKGAAPHHKNCVRASRGAIGRFPVLYRPNAGAVIGELKAAGVKIIGTSANAETVIGSGFKPPKKFAAVIGNETAGMSAEVSGFCDIMLKIEMAPGQSSFNVAVAAGIILNRLTY